MDLGLDESQAMLRATFAEFFANECPTSRVREAEPLGHCPELWRALVDMGAPGVGVDEAQGGSGGSLLDMLLIAEEVGAAAAPVPFVEAAVAARLLETLAPAEAAARALLDDALSGDERPAVALDEASTRPVQLVPAGAIATTVLVLHGDALRAATLRPGDDAAAPPNLGTGPIARLDLGALEAAVLARGPRAREAWLRALDEWRLATAATLVGLSRRALEIGVAYAKERIQFGVPIGSFQAIAHRLADAATDVDGARLLVWESAWAETARPERFSELCAMAFAWAAQTARAATETSLHVHGGYGFSLEYDIQLYYRRALAWALVGGGARAGRRAVADLRYGPFAGA